MGCHTNKSLIYPTVLLQVCYRNCIKKKKKKHLSECFELVPCSFQLALPFTCHAAGDVSS